MTKIRDQSLKNKILNRDSQIYVSPINMPANYTNMNLSREHNYPQPYIDRCQHSEIQALKPNGVNTDEMWIPTSEQLHELLKQKLPYPEQASFKQTANGWEYQTYLREWADDYGTYINTHRQFVGTHAESVLMQVLMTLLGIEERWMV